MTPRKQWTEDEKEIVRRTYPDTKTSALAEQLGCKNSQVYSLANRLGLHKSDSFFFGPDSGRTDGTRGRSTRFSKGHRSWNKGIHFNSGGASIATRFKPGAVPPNRKPVGTQRISVDGYLEIKVAEGMHQWRLLHREIWKQNHGAYPDKGMALAFRDGNKLNCSIENLELITRRQLMDRNTVHNLPEEIKEVIRLNGVIRRKIHGK